MIFFGKKRQTQKEDDYYRYRDSLTGQMNREYLFKRYESLKGKEGCKAVTVRLTGCDCMPYSEASEKIREAGLLIARICPDMFSRVENGDFVLLSYDADAVAERLEFFLDRLNKEGEIYSVCVDEMDKNEDFGLFLRRVQRHVGAVAKSIMLQML